MGFVADDEVQSGRTRAWLARFRNDEGTLARASDQRENRRQLVSRFFVFSEKIAENRAEMLRARQLRAGLFGKLYRVMLVQAAETDLQSFSRH
jgi:hypothetical protein